MLKSDFYYALPDRLIAQEPLPDRSASRLLCLDGKTGLFEDRVFTELPLLLGAGDLLVLNDTRVIPARLYGRKQTGGRVEILIERLLGHQRAIAHVRASKAPKPGAFLLLDQGYRCKVCGREKELFLLEFECEDVESLLGEIGRIPLPPYIDRPAEDLDVERYQTIYARKSGAVAAPTAGLHFDARLSERLKAKGIDTAFVTLHIGSGTFQPVRVENLDDHKMHAEYFEVGERTVEQVRQAHARGGRIVAVGTTAVRALESAAKSGTLSAYRGETDLFIRPGFRFRCVDALVTNFHLPESTLLALVCAFAGYEPVMLAYRHAVEQEYRFFSYGDAMFLTRADG